MTEFEIYGGAKEARVGPVSVTTAEILTLAARHQRSGLAVLGVGKDVAGLALSPALVSAGALDPLGSARVRALMLSATTGVPGGRGGVLQEAARLMEHARRTNTAAAAYELTEGRLAQDFTDLRAKGAVRLGLFAQTPVGAAMSRFVHGPVLASLALDAAIDRDEGGTYGSRLLKNVSNLTTNHPLLAEWMISSIPGYVSLFTLKPTSAENVTSGLADLVRLANGVASPGTLVVRQRENDVPGRAAGNLSQMFAGLDRASKRGPGYTKTDSTRVDTIRNPGQPDRYVVYLPPTQDWTDGSHPADGRTNVLAAAGRDNDNQRMALEAMRRAGVPEGAEVMLVGYSQGGLVAAQMAASSKVRAKYRIRAVATLGAPVAEHLEKIPSDISTLHVEHDEDPVVMGDGRRNSPSENHVTVRTDAPLLNGRPAQGAADAHNYERYMETVKALDQVNDRRLNGFRADVQDFMAGDDATLTWDEYTGTREKETPPRSHVRPKIPPLIPPKPPLLPYVLD